MASYDPYSDNWISLGYTAGRGDLKHIFVTNEDEMYALVFYQCKYGKLCRQPNNSRLLDTEIENCSKEKHVSCIKKYKPESNSWQDISSFDHMNLRHDFCVVANDNFVYFTGGAEWNAERMYKFLADVVRYDLKKNQWDKVADIQMARKPTTGAAANEKIFIAGGPNKVGLRIKERECEMFNERTNEWQFIASFGIPDNLWPRLLSVDNGLYVLPTHIKTGRDGGDIPLLTMVKCYDPDKNEWEKKTDIPLFNMGHVINTCSTRIFKRFLYYGNQGKKEVTQKTTSPSVQSSRDLSSPRSQAETCLRERRQSKCCFIL